MLRMIVGCSCCLVLGIALVAESRLNEDCALTLQLTDAETGQPVPGWVRFRDGDGNQVKVSELFPRDLTPGVQQRIDHWSVIVKPTVVKLPRRKIVVEALFGLETERATVTVDLSGKAESSLSIPLKFFYRAKQHGYRSANTHLHLMKLNREDSDRYLREIPKADGLDVLFLSYLERAEAQKDYISNRYTQADLDELTRQSGVAFGNGEEHRHNFAAQGQGFGHVMLLDIKQLILPVSIGQGIMKTGTDGLPVQRGIDQARRDGATIIWCHNDFGLEDIPNLVSGRIHALNIFDGNRVSSYKHSFYRYLNAGLRVPFSTGTDWFMYDFARVYVPANQTAVTPRSWLKNLAAGQSYITNGPFLELRVAGKQLGETVKLSSPGEVEISARAVGRLDFERIELIQNGKVIKTQASHPEEGHFVAEIRSSLPIEASSWLALRLPPQPVKDDPELTAPVPLNELGQPLFAHTSPIYVEVAGRRIFDRAVAESLIAEMEESIRQIGKQGLFADEEEKARVHSVYLEGIDILKKQLADVR
jgi:hypothetical protein